MTNELPPQSELDQIPPYRQELIDEWLGLYNQTSGEVSAYNRIIERIGEDNVSPEILAERDEMVELNEYYKKCLDGQR